MNVVCKICNEKLKNIKSLTNHIWMLHNVKIKDYYDRFYKIKYEEYCENPCCISKLENRPKYTKFGGGLVGYRRFCSNYCSSRINHKQIFNKVNTDHLCEYGCNKIAKPKI